jgi:phenylpropionate dioxygenase-like ring-hydroxylating dioxygenase large terminal subunit
MSASSELLERLSATVRPEDGIVPAYVFTSPEVYQLELERIFQRCWLFVAHETEVAQSGDYVTREMGEQPVIVSRGEDGVVRVFLNLCRHRGMQIARADLGNSSHFRCPYHGFTYTCTGQLTGVPFQQAAYGQALDKSELSLIQARVESYRGMIFATWNQDAEPLTEFLGNMAWYLDILVGRAEMEVIGPPQKWSVPTAWKWPAENFVSDAYHTAHTHASIARLDLVPTTDFGRSGYHVTAGLGHGLGIGVQEGGNYYPPELRDEFQRNLTAEQFELFNQVKNYHGSVFPNLSFLIPTAIKYEDRQIWCTTLRLWQPRGPQRIEVQSWCLVEKHAPDWWKELARRSYVLTFGISGMLEQDDTENWEAQTRLSAATLPRNGEIVLNYSMGLGRQPLTDFPGPGTVYDGKFNEANARAFHRRWLEYMLANEALVAAGNRRR